MLLHIVSNRTEKQGKCFVCLGCSVQLLTMWLLLLLRLCHCSDFVVLVMSIAGVIPNVDGEFPVEFGGQSTVTPMLKSRSHIILRRLERFCS
jgi:hypothetical protein